MVREEKVVLEQYDSYHKQTYRNRCRIMGPNGMLDLSIPVKREHGKKNHLKDIRIDYDTPWNKIHWKSLVAAYAASPFFEFLADELSVFYVRKFAFLVDLNFQLIMMSLNVLGKKLPLVLSTEFKPGSGPDDPRVFLHPKIDGQVADPLFTPVNYHQVFADKHGFQPNLSILDLLFNEGSNSLTILRESLRISDPG